MVCTIFVGIANNVDFELCAKCKCGQPAVRVIVCCVFVFVVCVCVVVNTDELCACTKTQNTENTPVATKRNRYDCNEMRWHYYWHALSWCVFTPNQRSVDDHHHKHTVVVG